MLTRKISVGLFSLGLTGSLGGWPAARSGQGMNPALPAIVTTLGKAVIDKQKKSGAMRRPLLFVIWLAVWP